MRCVILLSSFLFMLPIYAQDEISEPDQEADYGWPDFRNLPVMNQYRISHKKSVGIAVASVALPVIGFEAKQKIKIYRFLKGADLYLQNHSHDEIINNKKYIKLLDVFNEFHATLISKHMAGISKTRFAEAAVAYAEMPIGKNWHRDYYRPCQKTFLPMLLKLIVLE